MNEVQLVVTDLFVIADVGSAAGCTVIRATVVVLLLVDWLVVANL